MKATRYFSDYQSAYNYYGGNVVPSTEIALIGDGSYIFVSSDNAVSGNQQYFDVSMTNDEIVDTMTYTAYNNGVSYGEAVGFETGYTAGTTYGEAIGYAQGYEGGYSYGYSYGYSEGEAQGGGSLSLNDLTILERGKYITDRGSNYSNPYSWSFVHQMYSAYYSSIFNQYPDVIPDVFGDVVNDFWTIYKISSNEVSRITDFDNGVHGFEVDPETGDKVMNEGDYGYITVDLEAGDKVGFWHDNYFLLSIDPATNLNDHWFEIETTGTYILKYELTNWVEDPETGDGYWEVEGSFELVQE